MYHLSLNKVDAQNGKIRAFSFEKPLTWQKERMFGYVYRNIQRIILNPIRTTGYSIHIPVFMSQIIAWVMARVVIIKSRYAIAMFPSIQILKY